MLFKNPFKNNIQASLLAGLNTQRSTANLPQFINAVLCSRSLSQCKLHISGTEEKEKSVFLISGLCWGFFLIFIAFEIMWKECSWLMSTRDLYPRGFTQKQLPSFTSSQRPVFCWTNPNAKLSITA